jgi:hypothetical protein
MLSYDGLISDNGRLGFSFTRIGSFSFGFGLKTDFL